MREAENFGGGVYFYANGVLDEPGDRDYHLIEVEAGAWWTLATVANPDADP